MCILVTRLIYFFTQDRPDLIRSELAGLAFSSLQQVFRQVDIDAMFAATPMPFVQDEDIFLVIDPAAGGPGSDYAVVSFTRQRGVITVSLLTRCSTCRCTPARTLRRSARCRRRC